jgi:double-GTPase-like protein
MSMFERDRKLGRVMDIVMLGPRGVGKTSLLASLYDQFSTVVGESPLELSISDSKTRNLLQAYREDLRRFARGGSARDAGIVGSSNLREFLLGLGTQGRRPPQMTLRFTDFPGGLLNADDSHPDRAKLNATLPRAGAVFIAVDSPVIMERDGQYNDVVNQPEHVLEFVKDTRAGFGDKLVVIVPLKCEKYAASPAGMRELAVQVKKHYQPVVDSLASSETPPAGVVLATVQTVGSMHFSRFEQSSDGFREVYRLHRLDATYSPQDTDQPLRWLLRFAVNGFMARDKTFREKFGDWWNETDLKLTEALRQFGADCKKGEGFEVLHHHEFLELP